MVKVKKLFPGAIIPTRAHGSDAAFDLYAFSGAIIKPGARETIRTGIAIEMPEGYAGFIWPRSGLALKNGIDTLAGVIDAGFRGESCPVLINHSNEAFQVKPGDRIAQITFQKVYPGEIEVVDELSPSPRDTAGWGSTG